MSCISHSSILFLSSLTYFLFNSVRAVSYRSVAINEHPTFCFAAPSFLQRCLLVFLPNKFISRHLRCLGGAHPSLPVLLLIITLTLKRWKYLFPKIYIKDNITKIEIIQKFLGPNAKLTFSPNYMLQLE